MAESPFGADMSDPRQRAVVAEMTDLLQAVRRAARGLAANGEAVMASEAIAPMANHVDALARVRIAQLRRARRRLRVVGGTDAS